MDTRDIDKIEQKVTPWETYCDAKGFEYEKIVNDFGVQKIDQKLINRFEKVTGHQAHMWMRRGIFFAHRELDEILNDFEIGKQIFLYTGRGPSTEALHLGHMIPFMFIKWLQDVFDAILVIQIADDEKYYFKDLEFDKTYNLGFENSKDIIACGFNPEKTFIFSTRDYNITPCAHQLVHEMFKKININSLVSIFGLKENDNIGKYISIIYQMAASLSRYFEPIFGKNKIRCLIAYAIDQDPYFRGIRDKASQLNSYKPCSIISQFLPALEGRNKMSSTNNDNKTIFMTDNPKNISNLIRKYAFSGGCQTLEEHRKYGANLEIDIPFQYLKYFMSDDDELNRIAKEYGSGRMTSAEIKKILSDILILLITDHQKKRNAITNDDVHYFYNIEKFKKY
jgi:tryptophanyl-tRNA synthetase